MGKEPTHIHTHERQPRRTPVFGKDASGKDFSRGQPTKSSIHRFSKMSAGGKQNRIAPLSMQVMRTSSSVLSLLTMKWKTERDAAAKSITWSERRGETCVWEWNGKACRRCRCIIYWPTLTFSLFFPRTRKVSISNRKFSRKPKRLKYPQHKHLGRLYVYFMMIVRSTECISGASREASFSGETFSSRKVKKCLCFLLLQRWQEKIFSFILCEKLNEIEIFAAINFVETRKTAKIFYDFECKVESKIAIRTKHIPLSANR